jgi:hypothetical protein
VRLTTLELASGSLKVRAGGLVEGLTAPSAASTATPKLPGSASARLSLAAPLEELWRLLPPAARQRLEGRGWQASGPVEAQLAVSWPSGRTPGLGLELAVDLQRGRLALRDFRKPAGVPLRLQLAGRLSALAAGRLPIVELEPLTLTLGTAQVALRGQVRAADDIDLAVASLQLDLGAARAHLPGSLRQRLERVQMAGRLHATGRLRRQGGRLEGRLKASLRELHLSPLPARRGLLPGSGAGAASQPPGPLELDGRSGAAEIELSYRGELPGATGGGAAGQLRVDLDLSRVALLAGPLDKPAGQAARLGFDLDLDLAPPGATPAGQRVRRARLSNAHLQLGALSVERADLSLSGDELKVALRQVRISARDLARLLPGRLPRSPGAALSLAATAHLDLVASGRRSLPAQVAWEITLHELGSPAGTLRGKLTGRGLAPPSQLDVDLQSEGLDTAPLLAALQAAREAREARGTAVAGDARAPAAAPAPGAAAAAGSAPSAAAPLAALEKTALRLALRVNELRLRPGWPVVQKLEARVEAAAGRAQARRLRLTVLGGQVDLSGSAVELKARPLPAVTGGDPALRVWLRGQLKELDLGELGKLRAALAPGVESGPRLQAGRLDLDADVAASGAGKEALLSSLHGRLDATISDVRAHVVFQRRLRPKRRLLARLVERARRRQEKSGQRAEADVQLTRGTARLVLRGGDLFTREPVRVTSPDAELTVSGRLGSLARDLELDLDARLLLYPEGVEKATRGRLITAQTVPLTLHFSGTRRLPLVEFSGIGETLRALRGAHLGRGLRGRVDQIAGPLPSDENAPEPPADGAPGTSP